MADEEHVKLLKQGVIGWNQWRRKVARPIPDLTGVSLTGAYLPGANLSGANLYGAYLAGTNLYGADLNGANLNGANLSGANLTSANLDHANLSGANLSGANLSGANLTDANLTRANLYGVNLHRANLYSVDLTGANLPRANLNNANLSAGNLNGVRLGGTIFGDVELAGVVGLEACQHLGPSVIDYQTIKNSGQLPISFLRGVGLPDLFIEYLPSLLGQAIQYYSCFISYSHKDEEFAKRIHADLQNEGVRCWFAPHDLPIGGKLLDDIDAAIRLRDKVLLVLSKNSIKSDWVEDEVTRALEEERKRKALVLFPIKLDETVMKTSEAWARGLRIQRHIGDFRDWKDHNCYKETFDRVLRDLKRAAE